jgi:Golgi phosphoprotein 3 GPP34
VTRGLDSIRVADQVYWLAHREDQQARLQPRVMGVVLAGALLGELIIDERIGFWRDDLLTVVPDRRPARARAAGHGEVTPDVTVAAFVFDEIAADGHQRLATWVEALGSCACEQVVERLQSDGLLATRTLRFGRVGPGQGPALTERGRSVAHLPWALLSRRLDRGERVNVAGAFVVAVAMVAGLKGSLLNGTTDVAERYAWRLAETLPPDLLQVVAAVEAAAGKAVLVQRH